MHSLFLPAGLLIATGPQLRHTCTRTEIQYTHTHKCVSTCVHTPTHDQTHTHIFTQKHTTSTSQTPPHNKQLPASTSAALGAAFVSPCRFIIRGWQSSCVAIVISTRPCCNWQLGTLSNPHRRLIKYANASWGRSG